MQARASAMTLVSRLPPPIVPRLLPSARTRSLAHVRGVEPELERMLTRAKALPWALRAAASARTFASSLIV
jgi:hypothetical protein